MRSAALTLFALICASSHAETLPGNALALLLAADYTVVYSDGVTKVGDSHESMPRETWDPRWDTLAVSSAPQSPECVAKGHQKAECYVTFQELATSDGHIGMDVRGVPRRRIELLESPKNIRVRYELLFKNGAWFVLDPPQPFVNAVELDKVLGEEVAEVGKAQASATPGSPHFEKLSRLIDYYGAERAKLQPLLR
jgi:hypothetical protein